VLVAAYGRKPFRWGLNKRYPYLIIGLTACRGAINKASRISRPNTAVFFKKIGEIFVQTPAKCIFDTAEMAAPRVVRRQDGVLPAPRIINVDQGSLHFVHAGMQRARHIVLKISNSLTRCGEITSRVYFLVSFESTD